MEGGPYRGIEFAPGILGDTARAHWRRRSPRPPAASFRRLRFFIRVQPVAKINITMSKLEQDAICLRCTLPDCLGVENPQCPIQVEQRRRWRKDYQLRKSAGYFAERAANIKAARQARLSQ